MTTYAGQWGPEPFIDVAGNALPSVQVTVYLPDGVTPATLYTDRTKAVGSSNPLPTGVALGAAGVDRNANAIFFAAPGRYVLVGKVGGVENYRSTVSVDLDPDEETSLGASVPVDGSYATAATVAWRTRATGDAQPRQQTNADGKRLWGDGTNPLDTNLYRLAASYLKSDGSLQLGDRLYVDVNGTGAAIYFGAAGDARLERTGAASLRVADTLYANADLVARLGTAPQTQIGALGPSGQAGIMLGSGLDTSLYRGGVGVVETGGYINAGGDIRARSGAATLVNMGAVGPASQSAISFQNGEATSILYRFAAGELRATQHLEAARELVSYAGDVTSQIRLAAAGGPGGFPAIYFGGASDTVIYRAAADQLKTDDNFLAALDIYANVALASQVYIGTAGPAGQAGLIFGNLADTNLYRSAADVLWTDDYFVANLDVQAGQDVIARRSSATKTVMGAYGPSGESGIVFGSAADTNLYRSAANQLKTDDAFVVAGSFAANGATDLVGGVTVWSQIDLVNTNISFGTGAGTKLGTLATQKLGFWGATPIVRPSAFTQTYATASKTHANPTAIAPPAGGTGTAAGGYDTAANRNLMITSVTNLVSDMANVKQVLNAVIDDLQIEGLFA